MRRLQAPIALVLSLSVPSVAFASPAPPAPTAPAPAAPSEPAPSPAEMTDEQKIELAKEKYSAAEGLAAEGKWVEAVPLYEEAYYLVPGKHGFAHKVGVAAFKAGDCNKANSYLKHFLTYGDPEKYVEKMDQAKQILGEISVSGCASDQAAAATTTTTTAVATDEEDPLGDSTREQRQDEAAESRKAVKEEKRGLKTGGIALVTVGGLGVVAGIVGIAIASGTANTLDELSTNATASGFPVGDYACRFVENNQCPYQLESRLRASNITAYVGLGVGGVALIGGAAMLAIYSINKKKSGGADPTEPEPDPGAEGGVELTGIAPMLVPGGGGGAVVELRF
ncbi:hypothetical protein [Plesiocystis pacifica]|nr:hypothetical protein [Plesiocystis pacifica]